MNYTPTLNTQDLIVVYPKLDNDYQAQTTESSTFILGQLKATDKTLLINQQPVQTSPSGYFCHQVFLDDTENCFKLTCNHTTHSIIIKRQTSANWQLSPPTTTQLAEWISVINSSDVDHALGLYLPIGTNATVTLQDVTLDLIPHNLPSTHKQQIIFGYPCTPNPLPPLNAQWVQCVLPPINTNSFNATITLQNNSAKALNITKTLSFPARQNQQAFDCSKNSTSIKTVVIDAGHGGEEDGAIAANGIAEKHLNLHIIQLVVKALGEINNINVIATRTDDSTLSLADRVNTAVTHKADLLVSLHHNALPDCADPSQRSGLCTLYTHPLSKAVAQYFQHSLCQATGLNNDGVFEQNLAVCRHNQCPSILLELGYLTNPTDTEWILDPQHQQHLAQHIAQAIVGYFATTSLLGLGQGA